MGSIYARNPQQAVGDRPNEWGIDYVPGTSDFWIWDENPY
jgi:hypothetical protein